MTAKRKQGGRPKLTEGARTKKIDVRFTENEYNAILEMESVLGISRTDLIRMRLLDNSQSMLINAKEMISLIDSIGTEMGRCGNNINQFARYVNILQKRASQDQLVVGKFNALFSEYIGRQSHLESSLRRAIRLLSR